MDVDAKVAALRGGADDYLAKPVHPQELSARVRGLLGRFAAPSLSDAPHPGPRPRLLRRKRRRGHDDACYQHGHRAAREFNRSVALVDANLQLGDHRVFLDLGPDMRSIVDVANSPQSTSTCCNESSSATTAASSSSSARLTPDQAELVCADQHQLQQVIEVLRSVYD